MSAKRTAEPESPPAALLRRARTVAEAVLAPRAQAVDRGEVSPAENLRALAEAGLLGLAVPEEYGGLGAAGPLARDVREVLAGACGTTTFLLFQHFGACSQLAASENAELRAELLPRLASGERFATLAFSHLRRPGPPAVAVEGSPEGFHFNGTAPWATGWGFATDILLAGTLPDGRSLWAMAPARASEALQVSPPMGLCAAGASATVSLTLRRLELGRGCWVKTIGREQLDRDTLAGLPSSATLSLGAAAAAIRLVRERGTARAREEVLAAADALEAERLAARAEVERWADRPADPEYGPHILQARSWCVELGVRAAHAAVIASGGAANSLDHPAQRLFREAMLYTLTGLTGELQAAVLGRLVRR